MELIKVENLTKKFGSVQAVDGISFQVESGVLFGLLGPNGAGKTTTINILSTLLPPDDGTAAIGGHDVRRNPTAVRHLIGIVPQEIALYQDLSAKDNIMFWGKLYGLTGRELKHRADELLELADLHQRGNQKVETFSGGMKRRLNMVAGLVHSPKVLYLDEPTVGIDAQARSRILEMIQGTGTELTVQLGQVKSTLQDIMNLSLGDILHLPQGKDTPLMVNIEGQASWLGEAGRIGQNRAIKLIRQLEKE